MAAADTNVLETDMVLRLARAIGGLAADWPKQASAAEAHLLGERLSDAFVLVRWSRAVAPAVLERLALDADQRVEAVRVDDDVDGEGSVVVSLKVAGEWCEAAHYDGLTEEMHDLLLDVGRVVAMSRRGW